MSRILVPVEERFWKHIVKHDGCWEWLGATHPAGYGLLGRGARNAGLVRATHVSWKIHRGEDVPKGMVIMHSCDNPPCCNPEHLQLGTHKDNNDDMTRKGRRKYLQPRYELENAKGILTDKQVLTMREQAKDAPPRRHGRIEFWEQLGTVYGVTPKYAQQICSPVVSHRPRLKGVN